MSNLKICRICLVTDVKMYKHDRYQLKSYYEQIMATKMNDTAGLPRYFCYECAAMLYKYHKFKEKCCKGQKLLKNLITKGSITIKSIHNIDRTNNNLISSLDIITTNNRVKTYRVRTRCIPKSLRIKPIEITMVPENDITNNDDSYIIDLDEKEANDSIKDNEPLSLIISEKKTEEIEQEIPESSNLEVENIFANNIETLSDDEKVFADDIKFSSEDEYISEVKKKKGKRKMKAKVAERKEKGRKAEESKAKKFEVSGKKSSSGLDLKNWLKINLTEEEAMQEFKLRGEQKRYLSAEFKCEECLRGFSKADMLTRHKKLRHNESVGPIECRFCHMRFKWKCFLNKHMKQHYTKYKCLRCDLVCPLETTALFHEEYHNGVTRKCNHCGEEFKHLTTYYTHLRTHRSEHVCTLCGASFVSAMGLRIHKKIKHLNKGPEAPQEEEEYCERCDVKFETKKAYEEHLIHSAKHVDGIEDLEIRDLQTSNPRKRRLKMKRNTRIPTDCHICGKHFETQASCRKHHLAEHPRTSFHPPNERQICEICGVSLAPGSVASHLNTHTREKIYSCNVCGRQFSSKGGMTTHQLTHTSEKPVQCTLCDKRFKQISSMKLHYRTFHLKEPYPKRNRKKNGDDTSKFDYGHEESDENMTIDRWR